MTCITIEGGTSTRSNHFTSFLFDFNMNEAVQFDDERVTKFSLHGILTDITFQQSVYMALYIRNDCLHDSFRNIESYPYFVSVAQQVNIETAIFKPNPLITECDFKILASTLGNNKLTGDAVSAFISCESAKPKLKVVSATSNLLSFV